MLEGPRQVKVNYDLTGAEAERWHKRTRSPNSEQRLANLNATECEVSATRGYPVVSNVRFHIEPLAAPVLDPRTAERHAECDEESASRIARDSVQACGTTVRDDSNARFAPLAGLLGWTVLDSPSRSADQTQCIEGNGCQDLGTIQVQPSGWTLGTPRVA